MDPLSAALTRFGILLLIAPAIGLLLKAAGLPGRAPGAAVVGGIVAGLLAGPLVLGSVRPGFYESIAIGAAAESRDLAELERLHAAEIVALRETGVSEAAIDERRAEHAGERTPIVEAADAALARHRLPMGLIAATLVGLAFLIASTLARRRLPRASDLPEVPPAIVSGLLVTLITTLGTAVLVTWLLALDRSAAVLIGAATAAGSAFTHLPMRWIGREGRRIAANAINVFAHVSAMVVLIVALEGEGRSLILAPVAGVFFGGLLRTRVRSTRRRRRIARGLVLWLFAAPLTAYLVSEADPRLILDSGGAMAFVLLAVLLAGMGHYLGAALGFKMFGTVRQRGRATTIWLESHALGVSLTQVMLLVILVAAGTIDGRTPAGAAVIVGLALGIASVELTMGLLRRFVRVAELPAG